MERCQAHELEFVDTPESIARDLTPASQCKDRPSGERMMVYQETFVQRDRHWIYVRDHPGAEPAIILMHGLPDNLHLYDRLLPCRHHRGGSSRSIFRVGSSDKPSGLSLPPTIKSVTWCRHHSTEARAVHLVAHDASGPPAIDWALVHPERLAGLVLLNTYYCEMPMLRPPEAVLAFLHARDQKRRQACRRCLVIDLPSNYRWQVGRFFRDADVRSELPALLYQQFDATPSSRPAFFCLNEDLLPTIRSRTKMIPKMKGVQGSVRIIFSDADSLPEKAAEVPGLSRVRYSWSQVLDTSSKWTSLNRWAANSGYAAYKERPGLTLVTKSPTGNLSS
jgi:pimeloyl-ACP methyl ester carboxylesterase